MVWNETIPTLHVERFIFAASSSTYGDNETIPKVEDEIGKPLSPYALTKYVDELYAHVFSITYGLKYIGIRYFNVFGPRQKADSPYSGVIPKFISALLKGENPVIYGDGNQTRDFIYVKNIAKANYEVALNDATGVYNIAHGKTTSINELLEIICEIMGYDCNPTYLPRPKGDIIDSVADITKAQEEFGFKSEHDFKKELKETIDYYVKEFNKE